MKNFIIKLFAFIIILVFADRSFGMFFSILQSKNKEGTIGRDNYIKNECDGDLIIIGSSRASHHYISNILVDSLKVSVYNAGRDGNGILLSYGLLLEMLNHHTPKYIVYDFTPKFDWHKGDNARYLPHLRNSYNNIAIKQLFEDVDANEKYKMVSWTYRVNSLIPHILRSGFKSSKDMSSGYIPIYGRMTNLPNTIDLEMGNSNVDIVKVKYLQKLIDLCREKDIYLTFAISPIKCVSKDYFDYGIDLALKNNVVIMTYNDSEFEDISLFQDPSHLNDTGAAIYTQDIAHRLKELGIGNKNY